MNFTPMGLNNIKYLQLTHFRDGKKFQFTLKIKIELFLPKCLCEIDNKLHFFSSAVNLFVEMSFCAVFSSDSRTGAGRGINWFLADKISDGLDKCRDGEGFPPLDRLLVLQFWILLFEPRR